jgi:hypothetical protein
MDRATEPLSFAASLRSRRPNGIKLLHDRIHQPTHVNRRRTMDCLGDDQNSQSFIPHGGIAALSICPAPSVGSSRAVHENYFARFGILCLARKCQVTLRPGRVSDFEVFRHLRNIKTATGIAKAIEIELQRSISG